MVAVQGKSRVVDDVPQHRPGIGDDGNPVLTKLGSESVRLQPTGQRDTGAADYRSTEADQQRRLVVKRGEAVHGVGASQGSGRGGTKGRQRPAVVGDLLGDELAACGAEADEREIARVARVRPVPSR